MQNFTQTGLGRRRLWCFYRDETGTGSFPNWGAHSWEAAERNWGLVLENEGIGCAAEGSEEVRNASLFLAPFSHPKRCFAKTGSGQMQ